VSAAQAATTVSIASLTPAGLLELLRSSPVPVYATQAFVNRFGELLRKLGVEIEPAEPNGREYILVKLSGTRIDVIHYVDGRPVEQTSFSARAFEEHLAALAGAAPSPTGFYRLRWRRSDGGGDGKR